MSGLDLQTPFVFVTYQPGAEAWLKAELAREHDLRPGYGRPGFVTFKQADDGAFGLDSRLRTVFARAWGLSLARIDAPDAAAVLGVLERALPASAWPLVLHVFEREPAGTRRDPTPEAPGSAAVALEASLRRAAPAQMFVAAGELPRPGQLVVDVVALLEPPAAWLGVHRHVPGLHGAWPGGHARLELPEGTPSRVWLKVEQGLRWSGFEPAPGERVLDIGCAPGGGSHALLERGLEVVGVDPGAVDERVLAHPRFTHLRVPFERLEPAELGRVDWLVFDVNLSPRLTLKALGRLVRGLPRLRGMLLTLKLNTDALAEQVPWMLERVREMGMATVRATQLPANRQEICVMASRTPTR